MNPFAFQAEPPPRTASVVWQADYEWGDQAWMQERRRRQSLDAPVAIYEVHLGSWRRVREEGNRPLTYRELAGALPDYVEQMGFTHVELLPLMEHPFYGSWGYQTTSYFAPTSRYGRPEDLMFLIDALLHACHRDARRGTAGRQVARNLVDGSSRSTHALLDELAYGTIGLQDSSRPPGEQPKMDA